MNPPGEPLAAAPSGAAPAKDLVLTAFVEREYTKPRSKAWLAGSMAGHAVLVALVVLAPLWYEDEAPPHVDYIRALIYNPPPPPPPPLPKGSSAAAEREPEKTGQKPKDPDVIVEPQIPDEPEPIEPEKGVLTQFGSATGSDQGQLNGMEGGKEGGVIGGTLGGVVGGVIGGTGDGDPVTDYDQPPRLIRQVQPKYPQEAFIKKIEGVVLLEIVIEADGTVRRARVIRSIPQLDAAAIETVKKWLFTAALRHGRPVPTVATAPVTFRIF